MNKFETKVVGGTMFFWNADQSVSGEVERSGNSNILFVSLDVGSEDITEKEEFLLREMFFVSEAASY